MHLLVADGAVGCVGCCLLHLLFRLPSCLPLCSLNSRQSFKTFKGCLRLAVSAAQLGLACNLSVTQSHAHTHTHTWAAAQSELCCVTHTHMHMLRLHQRLKSTRWRSKLGNNKDKQSSLSTKRGAKRERESVKNIQRCHHKPMKC